ncbi:UDP-glucose/GDP-mannose dehydrogenase family protein [Pseudomonas paracarnis]|uniref:UDP-glucose dehydrogenase family protein n=1 Tax=Pseudomonas paracarnis TaxID=2750625 RepID=UPI002FDFD139
MNVTVFGIGYVGLVQAAVLADAGHEVCCVDIDAIKVENLKSGIIPIYEPGLSALVQNNHDAGRLHFTTDAEQGVRHGEVQFIAVGTPPDDDGSADIKYVLAVAATIALNMTEQKIIVNKSTVPVGTADNVRAKVSEVLKFRALEVEFHVISNPEFLKEGSAVADCTRPDRIIIGSDSSYAVDRMRELYEPFNRNHEKIIMMDIRSAELTKYAANCLLATKISFMNEMANFAERLGGDIEAVRKGIGSDPRIGYDFIYPGCGYGGSCFPKDVQALERTASSIGYQATLLSAVEEVNKRQKQHLFGHIHHHFGGQLEGKTFAIWGLAFKPNTDDMREASSRVLIEQLRSVGARVQAFDPEAMAETQRIYGMNEDLLLMGTKEAALQGADALVIVTEWREFKAPDLDVIKEKLRTPVIFDGRNIFDPQRMKANGFDYYGIGRGLSVRPVI